MFKYWVVEKVYCFDTCVSVDARYNFRTKEEADEYYKSNKNKLSRDFSLREPKEVTIKFKKVKKEE